jgi:1-acyl-sn-glycerol-3-phosphate acyltransferase
MNDRGGAVRSAGVAVTGGTLRALWGIRVTGLERVPRDGPLLVACNHASLADPPLIAAAIEGARRPRFLAKKELFRIPGLSWFMRTAGVIELDRGSADHSAMREALQTLEEGGSIAIFPEGTRARAGRKPAPKTGVHFLASRTGARTVPARLVGTDELPWRTPLEVRFGEPLDPPPPGGREEAARFARAVMDAIYAL